MKSSAALPLSNTDCLLAWAAASAPERETYPPIKRPYSDALRINLAF